MGAKPVDETVVEAVLSLRIDDLEPRLTRSGYLRVREIVLFARSFCSRYQTFPSSAHH